MAALSLVDPEALRLQQPDTTVPPPPAPKPAVGAIDPRVLDFIASRLQAPEGLDREGLQAAQAADLKRDQDFRLAQAGERATSMMQRRAPNFEGLTDDSRNVRNWVAQRALANEDTERAMKLAMFGPQLSKASGEAIEANVKPGLITAQTDVERTKIPGIEAATEKTRQEGGLVAAQEAATRAGIPLTAAQAAAARATAAATAQNTQIEKDLNDPASPRSQSLVALGKAIKPDIIKDGMTGADAMKVIPGLVQVEAEMARIRASIAAENTGDADWQIKPQFADGTKKLPPAAHDFLLKSPGARALLDNSARAEALIQKHPDGVITGNDAGDLHRWVEEMTSQLNGIWGMGILRQSNMSMLEKALNDPTQLSQILASKVKRQDFTTQLHQFQTMVKQRMYSEGTGTGALDPKSGGYYEGFQSASGKNAGTSQPNPDRVAHFRSQLQPGERLAMDAAGNAKALHPDDPVPAGFSEVK